LFFVDINSREVIHVATTRAPTEQWTAQQLRNTTPFGHGPEVIIRDRDQKYGTIFDRVAEGAGIEVLVTAQPSSPDRSAGISSRCDLTD
jgi:hypothetical protein